MLPGAHRPHSPRHVHDDVDAGVFGAWRLLRDRVCELRRDFGWSEASGAFGDLGTFVPLVIALTVECGVDIGTTLVFTGVYNVVTALMFDVPMPLQPMKTIAAAALSSSGGGLTVPQIVAAGIFVSVAVLVLGVSGMMQTFNRITPVAVIHGMQLGLGLLLCTKGYALAVYADAARERMRPALGPDGLLMGVAALVFTVCMSTTASTAAAVKKEKKKKKKRKRRCEKMRRADAADDDQRVMMMTTLGAVVGAGSMDEPSAMAAGAAGAGAAANGDHGESDANVYDDENDDEDHDHDHDDARGAADDDANATAAGVASSSSSSPVALALVCLGIIVALCRPGSAADLRFGPSTPSLIALTPHDVMRGVTAAGLPQLPLTTLNSVIAVCALSGDLFPDRPRLAPRTVAVSVGAMNLAGCAFGVVPCCHGAGGLAAHYHFGARRGSAVAFLGLCKLALGVTFGGSLLTLLRRFPAPVLGVMLAASSAELVRAGLGGLIAAASSRRVGSSGRIGRVTGDHTGGRTDGDAGDDDGGGESLSGYDVYGLIVTAAATVASKNTGVGCLFGFGVSLLAAGRKRWSPSGPRGGAEAPTPRGVRAGDVEYSELGNP